MVRLIEKDNRHIGLRVWKIVVCSDLCIVMLLAYLQSQVTMNERNEPIIYLQLRLEKTLIGWLNRRHWGVITGYM